MRTMATLPFLRLGTKSYAFMVFWATAIRFWWIIARGNREKGTGKQGTRRLDRED